MLLLSAGYYPQPTIILEGRPLKAEQAWLHSRVSLLVCGSYAFSCSSAKLWKFKPLPSTREYLLERIVVGLGL